MFCFVWGFQTDEAYSTCGRTKVLYASSFTASFLVFTFLLTKPRGNYCTWIGLWPDRELKMQAGNFSFCSIHFISTFPIFSTFFLNHHQGHNVQAWMKSLNEQKQKMSLIQIGMGRVDPRDEWIRGWWPASIDLAEDLGNSSHREKCRSEIGASFC